MSWVRISEQDFNGVVCRLSAEDERRVIEIYQLEGGRLLWASAPGRPNAVLNEYAHYLATCVLLTKAVHQAEAHQRADTADAPAAVSPV